MILACSCPQIPHVILSLDGVYLVGALGFAALLGLYAMGLEHQIRKARHMRDELAPYQAFEAQQARKRGRDD